MFSRLPDDIQYQILKNLDYKEIDTLCSHESFSERIICGKNSKAYKFAFDKIKNTLPKGVNMTTHAASIGDLSLLKRAIEIYGYNLSSAAYIAALRNGHLKVLKYLLEKDHKGVFDLLRIARKSKQDEIIKYLIDNFRWAFEQDEIEKIVKYAIKNENIELIKILDPKTFMKDDNLKEMIINSNNADIVKYFLEINNITKGPLFLSLIIKAINNGNLDVVKYLVGVNPTILRQLNFLEMEDTIQKDVYDFLSQAYDDMPNYDSDDDTYLIYD